MYLKKNTNKTCDSKGKTQNMTQLTLYMKCLGDLSHIVVFKRIQSLLRCRPGIAISKGFRCNKHYIRKYNIIRAGAGLCPDGTKEKSTT